MIVIDREKTENEHNELQIKMLESLNIPFEYIEKIMNNEDKTMIITLLAATYSLGYETGQKNLK